MVKKIPVLLLIMLILASACARSQKASEPHALKNDTPVEYYAVLAEKDGYADVDMTPLMVDYIDIKRLRGALEELGWPAENIRDLKEFDQDSLQTELDWLEQVADENDLVFFYVTGHGNFLRYHVKWNNFFPTEWAQINSYRRVLVVDSCTAAEFTNSLKDDPNPFISIAAVDDDEYGWKGVEEEGLPIIGGIFTFYFAEALVELMADENGDGYVSVQEAALHAEEKQRDYMHNIVFAVPEFVEMYHGIGIEPEKDKSFPDVIMIDSVGEELSLEVQGKGVE